MGGRPCVWMQAGVVSRKFCEIDYQCPECRYDRAMQGVVDENLSLSESGQAPKGKRARVVSWKDKMRGLPRAKRPCIHHMKGRINFRTCTNDYRCVDCEFDQYFYDEYTVHASVRPVQLLDVEGFKIPHGYYLHEGHTWIKMEEGATVRVGIDDFASRLLGPFDHVEAPLMGKEVKQGRGDITIIRDNQKAKVMSPVTGVVTAINPEPREHGTKKSEDAFSDGWIMRVHTKTLRKDIRGLMIQKESKDFIKNEVEQLHRTIEDVAGPLAADGGHFGDDIYGHMPELGWRRLTKLFLKTST